MSEFIKRMEEQRANLFSQIKDVIDGAEAESRGLDSSELEKIDRIEAEIESADRSIATAKTSEERMVEASAAAKGFVPVETDNTDETSLRSLVNGELRSASFEFRDITSSDSLVDRGFADEVFMAAKSVGPILETSQVFNTSEGNDIVYPVMNAYSTPALRAEGSALPSSDASFTNITLGAFKYGVLVPVSNELLTDSTLNIQSIIAEQAGIALGALLNAEHTTGDGSGNPNGIVTAATQGVVGAGTTPTADELIELVFSVGQGYRQRGSGFMVSTTAMQSIRSLKDNDGRYLYDVRVGEVDQFMGFPVFENVDMAATGNDAKSIIYGNLENYKVRLAGGIQISQSSDFRFDDDVTVFRAIARADGDLANTDSVKYFIGASA